MADRDSIAAAATAAVVLVLGIGFFVTRHQEAPQSAPTPRAEAGVPTCSAGDLVAGPTEQDLAAGTAYRTTTLRLGDGVAPCTLAGYPEAILLADGRPAGVETIPDQTLGEPAQLTVLPDRSAKVTVAWPVLHYCAPLVNDAIRLWVAPGLPFDVGGFGPASCNGDEGTPPVRVGAFTYVDPRDERGSVTGLVTLNDGPGPGTGEYARSGEVEFVGTDTTRVPIGATGSYDVDLPAGDYTVRVSTHQWHAGETYVAGRITVTGGELAVRNIPMPLR